jgi:hypothetical protein
MDTMPLTQGFKALMLLTIVFVAARAVNILT